MPKHKQIKKLEAAERQLKEAITLFFEERDPVAIHTLAHAAHEILYQVGKNTRRAIPIFYKPSWLSEEARSKWAEYFKTHYNFFKHAGRREEETIIFNLDLNELVLFDCVSVCSQLGCAACPEMGTFAQWIFTKHPDWIKDDEDRERFIEELSTLQESSKLKNPSDYLQLIKILKQT